IAVVRQASCSGSLIVERNLANEPERASDALHSPSMGKSVKTRFWEEAGCVSMPPLASTLGQYTSDVRELSMPRIRKSRLDWALRGRAIVVRLISEVTHGRIYITPAEISRKLQRG